ncbi:MAG: IS4 family transposase [Terrimicrobiaceae bacterium]
MKTSTFSQEAPRHGQFSSIFSQLLTIFSRADFERAVKKHKADRAAKGFDCWTQFVSMLFCQVGRAHSLREICGGLASVEGKLNHLGVGNAPARSTLSYANAHRPYALFEEVFGQLLERCRSLAAPKPFRFKNKLYSLDATVIDLCLSAFDWAKFRRTKGAIKLHLLLDHDGCLPCYGVITEGKTQEIRVARTLEWPPGSIVVMDRGYVDYGFLDSLEDRRVFFVTRLKENAAFSVEAEISASKGNIRADQMISLPGSGKNAKALRLFRRVVVWDEAREREIVLLTNNLKLAASTIAAIYKARWQIELFFKSIKQNLKIKTFVGTSPNAVRIQIWTALMAILLLKYLQMRSRLVWSLSNLLALLRLNLFVHRDLWAWVDQPFAPPPQPPTAVQTTLTFG